MRWEKNVNKVNIFTLHLYINSLLIFSKKGAIIALQRQFNIKLRFFPLKKGATFVYLKIRKTLVVLPVPNGFSRIQT